MANLEYFMNRSGEFSCFAEFDFSQLDTPLIFYSIGAFVTIGVILSLLILYTKAKCSIGGRSTIVVNDSSELTRSVPAGSSLLLALTQSGIPIPSPCGGKAACKQCRVQILEGADEPLETDKATFTKKQLKEGWRLSCQSKVRCDLKLHVDEHLLGVKEWKATVVSNKNVATFIKELVVMLPQGEYINYKSGGYLQFHVPPFLTHTDTWKETIDEKFWADWQKFGLFGHTIDYSAHESIIRAYSMASYPGEKERLMFNVRIASPPFVQGKVSTNIPWGICSSYIFSLKPGDEVHLSGPYGESFMINDDRDLYFLIGGAGSSFGRSHILHLFRTEKTKRKVSMWYGARSLRENIYQEEYENLTKEFTNFSYNLVLSEPLQEDITAGWDVKDPVKTNFLFKAFELGALKGLEAPEDALFYVCGPPMHNKSILKLLDEYGVARTSIILDDFGS